MSFQYLQTSLNSGIAIDGLVLLILLLFLFWLFWPKTKPLLLLLMPLMPLLWQIMLLSSINFLALLQIALF